jgi:hypothetical protein
MCSKPVCLMHFEISVNLVPRASINAAPFYPIFAVTPLSSFLLPIYSVYYLSMHFHLAFSPPMSCEMDHVTANVAFRQYPLFRKARYHRHYRRTKKGGALRDPEPKGFKTLGFEIPNLVWDCLKFKHLFTWCDVVSTWSSKRYSSSSSYSFSPSGDKMWTLVNFFIVYLFFDDFFDNFFDNSFENVFDNFFENVFLQPF